MAIDKRTFLESMALLSDRHGRTLGAPTLRAYKEHLDAHLTTAEFAHAARKLFIAGDYFPSPQQFVDEAKGDMKARMLAAWELAVQCAYSGGGYHPDPLIATATRAAGGPTALARAADEYELRRRRADFETAYKREFDKTLPALPRPELPGEEEA